MLAIADALETSESMIRHENEADVADAVELQVDMRFDVMESRITRVEEDVSFIRTCFDPPPPPPSSS